MAPAEFGPEPPSIGLPNTVFFLGTGGGEIEDWTAGNQSFGFESVVGKATTTTTYYYYFYFSYLLLLQYYSNSYSHSNSNSYDSYYSYSYSSYSMLRPPLPPLLACVGMSTFCPVNSHLIPDEQAKKRLTVGRSGYQLLATATTAQAIAVRRLWRLLFPLGQHVPPASQPSSYKYQPCNVWEVMMTLPSNFLLRLQRCTHESGDEQDSDPGCWQIAKLISMRM